MLLLFIDQSKLFYAKMQNVLKWPKMTRETGVARWLAVSFPYSQETPRFPILVILLFWLRLAGQSQSIVEVCGMSEKGCLVCCPRGEEGRMLLYFLRRTLLRLNRDYQPDFNQTNHSRPLNERAFTRLLTLLSHQTPDIHQENSNSTAKPFIGDCQHFRLGRYLRRKLRCDSMTFNQLCEQMIQNIAERNYHLSVLELQIKSALQTSHRIAAEPAYSALVDRVLAKKPKSTSPNSSPANHPQVSIGNEQQFIPKGQTTNILVLSHTVPSASILLPFPHETN